MHSGTVYVSFLAIFAEKFLPKNCVTDISCAEVCAEKTHSSTADHGKKLVQSNELEEKIRKNLRENYEQTNSQS